MEDVIDEVCEFAEDIAEGAQKLWCEVKEAVGNITKEEGIRIVLGEVLVIASLTVVMLTPGGWLALAGLIIVTAETGLLIYDVSEMMKD